MSIKAKMIIVVTFSLVVTITTGLILFQNSLSVQKESKKQRIISEMRNKIFQKSVLRNEYFLYREERPIVQLQIESEALKDLLMQVSSIETSADAQALISRLGDNIKFVDQNFARIVVNFKTGSSSPSANAKELEQGLISQLLTRAQDNFAISAQLVEVSRNKVIESQQKATFFILVFIAGIILVIICALYFIWRSIAKPLITLKQSALRIAALDFSTTTTTTTTGKDEIGQLAGAFNEMAAKLKESYSGLEIKVQERTNELTEAKAKIEAILYSIGDAVFAIDINEKIVMMNDAAVKLSGFSVKEAKGKNYRDILKFIREKDGTVNDQFIRQTMVSGEPRPMENDTMLVAKNGLKIPIADSAAPLKDTAGKVIGCVVVFRDISKELEAKGLRTDFLSLASHQLRTPLSGTKWLIETMQSGVVGKMTKKQQEYIDQIYMINERMIKLVFDMLNVLRLEGATLEIHKQTFALSDLVKDLLLRVETAAQARRIAIVCPVNSRQIQLESDFEAIKSILESFLSNAVNYSHPGQNVFFNVKEEPDELVFFVKDKGIGMPKDEQKRIFEKFYRSANAKLFKPDGTGLGLYMSSMLAKRIGAKVSFESEEGKGSTFYLHIPKSMGHKENL